MYSSVAAPNVCPNVNVCFAAADARVISAGDATASVPAAVVCFRNFRLVKLIAVIARPPVLIFCRDRINESGGLRLKAFTRLDVLSNFLEEHSVLRNVCMALLAFTEFSANFLHK